MENIADSSLLYQLEFKIIKDGSVLRLLGSEGPFTIIFLFLPSNSYLVNLPKTSASLSST